MFLLHEEKRTLLQVYMDACMSGAGGVLRPQAYHARFPPHVLSADPAICHLEALNAVVALTLWADRLRGQLVHLFSDSSMAVMVFQAGRGRDELLQSCPTQLWLVCAQPDITLRVGHVPGQSLLELADALSR